MLKLFNTLTRQTQEFKPLKPKQAKLYTCGPTVYNYAHMGNLRTYIFEDILKRVLTWNGLTVRHIMNLTDVDDKTILNSQAQKETLKKFTNRYTKIFQGDIKLLNILPPAKFAPATHYIKEMVKLVQILLKKGVAYQKDGSTYFSIKNFPAYGRLSGLIQKDLKINARVDNDEYDKADPSDFVLWKAWTERDGNVFWKTTLGKGRPGWHLECSAISSTELGQPFDIHAGAVDLIFPHHENEIAQSEAAYDKPLAIYWLHGEHLLVDNQRMAKSLHNFYTLRDLETKNFSPLAYRLFILGAHYRAKINFTWEALQASQNALNNLYTACREIPKPKPTDQPDHTTLQKFNDVINNDLNTPQALAIVWELLKSNLPDGVKSQTLLRFDAVLGLDVKKYLNKKIKISVPPAVKKLLTERQDSRLAKNWAEADRLRKEINRFGWEVEDTAAGSNLKKL